MANPLYIAQATVTELTLALPIGKAKAQKVVTHVKDCLDNGIPILVGDIATVLGWRFREVERYVEEGKLIFPTYQMMKRTPTKQVSTISGITTPTTALTTSTTITTPSLTTPRNTSGTGSLPVSIPPHTALFVSPRTPLGLHTSSPQFSSKQLSLRGTDPETTSLRTPVNQKVPTFTFGSFSSLQHTEVQHKDSIEQPISHPGFKVEPLAFLNEVRPPSVESEIPTWSPHDDTEPLNDKIADADKVIEALQRHNTHNRKHLEETFSAYTSLQTERNTIKSSLAHTTSDLKNLAMSHDKTTEHQMGQIQNLQQQIENLQQDTSAKEQNFQKQIKDSHDHIQNLEMQLGDQDRHVQNLQQQIEDLQHDTSTREQTFKKQIEDSQDHIQHLETQLSEFDRVKGLHQQVLEQLQAYKSVNEQLQQQVQHMRSSEAEKDDIITSLRVQLLETEKNTEVQPIIQSLKEDLDANKENLSQIKRQVNQLNSEKDALLIEKDHWSFQQQQYVNQIQILHSNQQTSQDMIADLRNTVDNYSAQLQALHKANSLLEAEANNQNISSTALNLENGQILEENRQLRDQVKSLEEQCTQLTSDNLKKIAVTERECEKRLHEYQGILFDLQAQCENQIQAQKNEITQMYQDQMAKQKAKDKVDLDQVHAHYKSYISQLREKQETKIKNVQSEKLKLDADIKGLKDTIFQLETDNVTLKDTVDAKQKDIDHCAKKHDQTTHLGNTTDSSSLKTILTKPKSGQSWQCSACYNINYWHRIVCNACQSPNPNITASQASTVGQKSKSKKNNKRSHKKKGKKSDSSDTSASSEDSSTDSDSASTISSSSSSDSSSSDDHGKKKRKRRNRRRSRSPQIGQFDGDPKSKLDWETFITKFKIRAKSRKWPTKKKCEKLMELLTGAAFKYARALKIRRDFNQLTHKMNQRFNPKQSENSARKQLSTISQNADESIEEFHARVHYLALEGYKGSSEKTILKIALEAFIGGLLDKRAAEIALSRNPKDYFKALRCVKDAQNNQAVLYANRRKSVHQSELSDSEDPADVLYASPNSRPGRPTTSTSNQQSPNKSRSPSPFRRRSPSPRQPSETDICYDCGQRGHFTFICSNAAVDQKIIQELIRQDKKKTSEDLN